MPPRDSKIEKWLRWLDGPIKNAGHELTGGQGEYYDVQTRQRFHIQR